MNLDEIKALALLLEQSDLSVLEVAEGDRRIRLEKTRCEPAPVKPAAPSPAEADESPQAVDFNDIGEIKSPMVGVFYQAPTPDDAPYVAIGDRVRKGQVLCIIEAMKLMNEIVCETDGEIVDICAENGQVVEYGQTLFKVF